MGVARQAPAPATGGFVFQLKTEGHDEGEDTFEECLAITQQLEVEQLQGNLSRKGFVPIRESIGNVPWRIFVVVFSWRSHNADAQTPLS